MSAGKNRNADLYLADALSEQVERTPPSELLAEAAEDFSNRRGCAREFDQVFARAMAQKRRQRFSDRIKEFAARAWTLAGPRSGALAALALLVIAAGAYFAIERWREQGQRDAELARHVTDRVSELAKDEARTQAARDESIKRQAAATTYDEAVKRCDAQKAQMEAEQARQVELARRLVAKETDITRLAAADMELTQKELSKFNNPAIATRGAKPPPQVWSAYTGRVLAELSGYTAAVSSCAFSSDGTQLATVSDRIVRLWNAQTGYGNADLVHDAPVVSMAFSPNGQQVATITETNLRLWDTSGRLALLVTMADSDRLRRIAFTPDGQHLAVALADNTIRQVAVPVMKDTILYLAWGSARIAARLPEKPATLMVLDSTGSLLATVSVDNVAHIWDFESGKLVRTLGGHSGKIAAVAFSPDGRRLVTAGSTDQSIRVWDVASGALQQSIGVPNNAPVTDARFSPDGNTLITAAGDGTARIWNIASGASVATLVGHKGDVTSATFSPDGRFIATTSEDKTARVWNVAQDKKQ